MLSKRQMGTICEPIPPALPSCSIAFSQFGHSRFLWSGLTVEVMQATLLDSIIRTKA